MSESVKLDDRSILRIGWLEEPGYFLLCVGSDGVTKIDAVEQYLGEYSIVWLQVWKGKKLQARYNARNVDMIEYEEM